jgi:hypothetical protein
MDDKVEAKETLMQDFLESLLPLEGLNLRVGLRIFVAYRSCPSEVTA